MAFFLFKDIKLQAVKLDGGDACLSLRDQIVQVGGIHASLNSKQVLEVFCNASACWPQNNMSVTAPCLHIKTDSGISFVNPEIKVHLTARKMGFQSPEAEVENVGLEARLKYEQNQKKLSFEPINLHLKEITLNQGREKQKIPLNLHLKIEGAINLKDKDSTKEKIPELTASIAIKGDGVLLAAPGLELLPFETRLALSGSYPVYMVKDLTASFPRTRVRMGEQDVQVDDIVIRIDEGRIDGEERSLFLPEIHVNSSLLKNLVLSLMVDGKEVVARLQGKDARMLDSARALCLLPPGWQWSGVDSLQARAVLKDMAEGSFNARLGFQNLAFQDSASIVMGENIFLHADVDGKISLKQSRFTVGVSLKAHEGEILYDKFYQDLKSNAFFVTGRGEYDIIKRSLHVPGLSLGLQDLLFLSIHGDLLNKAGASRFNFFVNVPKTALKPAFDNFILEPFQLEKPFLNALNIEGIISADLKLTGAVPAWELKGRCLWEDGELSSGKSLALEGIDLDLPIWYRSLQDGRGRSKVKGGLSVRTIMLPHFTEQALSVNFDAGPNSLSVNAPTDLRIPGGTVGIGEIAAVNIFSPRPSIKTSLTVNAVEINSFLSGIRRQPIYGTISGKLDPVCFDMNTLSAEGKLRARIFGGEVILSDPSASGMVLSSPFFRVNAEWRDLSLEQLTSDTSFGKIEGVLSGHINNL